MARRAPLRRGRATTRFTPRRWLPVVALSSLVAAVVVLHPGPAQRELTGTGTSRLAAILPTAAPARALSAAWYCGGGSGQGANGPAEMTIVITNDDATRATAHVTVVDDRGRAAARTVAVSPHAATRILASRIHRGRWIAATVEVRRGRAAVSREVVGSHGFDAAPCASSAAAQWYVASGSTKRGAQQLLSIYNPLPSSATVDVSFATESGSRQPKELQGLSIPPRALQVVRVNDTVTARARVAATVRSRVGQVVVDRLQSYDGSGDALDLPDLVAQGTGGPGSAPEGLVSTPAVPGVAERWMAAGGSGLAPGTLDQVAVYNPSDRQAAVDVALTYEEPGRNPEMEPIQLTLPPHQQQLVDLADAPGIEVGIPYVVDVRSLQGVGVIAELLATGGDPASVTGAAVTGASPVAARRWIVDQVGSGRSQTPSVVVSNPGRRRVKVRVVQVGQGSRRTVTSAGVLVPAGDRRSIDLSRVADGAAVEVIASHGVVVGTALDADVGLGRSSSLGQPFPESIEALAAPPS